MIDFLLGVPAQLKTLVDRLTSTWAAKLDTLETRLSSLRAGYLDKLNLSGKCTDDAVWTNIRAGYLDKLEIDPTRDAPIATDFPTPSTSGSTTHTPNLPFDFTLITACAVASTASTTLTDAVNITGSGVLNFLATGGGTYTQVQLIIDGVTVKDTTKTSALGTTAIVGAVFGGSTSPGVAFDQIPFKTSLVIKHRSSATGTTYTYYKLRRTS